MNRPQDKMGLKLNNSLGFTLIEVMIAVTIFSFLMLYISQFMKQEMRLHEETQKQFEVDDKARIVMMTILDEIRLRGDTYFESDVHKVNSAVYFVDNRGNALIDQTLFHITNQYLYYDADQESLWYRTQNDTGNIQHEHLVADKVEVEITPIVQSYNSPSQGRLQFVKIWVRAEDSSETQPHVLLTWVRLN